MKDRISKGRRTPTQEGRMTPTEYEVASLDIFCDESTAGGVSKGRAAVKSVRPNSGSSRSRRKIVADIDTGLNTSVSSSESRAKRIERSRQRVVESTRSKSPDRLYDYSGSPQKSTRRRERSQSRSPVAGQVSVVPVHPKKRPKSRTTTSTSTFSQEKKYPEDEKRVVSPTSKDPTSSLSRNKYTRRRRSKSTDLDAEEAPLNPLRPDSRASQFADDEKEEEEEETIVEQVSVVPVRTGSPKRQAKDKKKKKSVQWHSGVKSCYDDISSEDDVTEDGTVSTPTGTKV